MKNCKCRSYVANNGELCCSDLYHVADLSPSEEDTIKTLEGILEANDDISLKYVKWDKDGYLLPFHICGNENFHIRDNNQKQMPSNTQPAFVIVNSKNDIIDIIDAFQVELLPMRLEKAENEEAEKNTSSNSYLVSNSDVNSANITKSTAPAKTSTSSWKKNSWDKWGKYGYYGYNPVPKPTETKEPKTINIVYHDHNVLKGIVNRCLPIAGGCEFQYHYWNLQLIFNHENGNRIVFTVPLIYFNFNQTVTTGSVAFNVEEIEELNKELEPYAQEMVQAYMPMIKKAISAFNPGNNFKVDVRIGETGSIHRHPGRFGFSSIDLTKDPEKPGVIFRNEEAEDAIQIDSVMYIHNANNVELFTTETRVVNVHKTDPNDHKKGIEGTYAESNTYMFLGNKEPEMSGFEDFFGIKPKKSFELKKFEPNLNFKINDEIQEKLEKVIEILAEIEPEDIVDEKLIKANTYTYYKGKKYNYGSGYSIKSEEPVSSKSSKKNKKKKKKENLSGGKKGRNQKSFEFDDYGYNGFDEFGFETYGYDFGEENEGYSIEYIDGNIEEKEALILWDYIDSEIADPGTLEIILGSQELQEILSEVPVQNVLEEILTDTVCAYFNIDDRDRAFVIEDWKERVQEAIAKNEKIIVKDKFFTGL